MLVHVELEDLLEWYEIVPLFTWCWKIERDNPVEIEMMLPVEFIIIAEFTVSSFLASHLHLTNRGKLKISIQVETSTESFPAQATTCKIISGLVMSESDSRKWFNSSPCSVYMVKLWCKWLWNGQSSLPMISISFKVSQFWLINSQFNQSINSAHSNTSDDNQL